jgi:hypothetical protein
VKEAPAGQPNSAGRLLEARTRSIGVVVPESKNLAIHINRDPAVVLERDHRPVAVLRRVFFQASFAWMKCTAWPGL